MTKHYATSEKVLVESASIPGAMHESTIEYFKIDGTIYNIEVDANAPTGEPTFFIKFNGKTPVQTETLGYNAGNLCFDSVEAALQETGLAAADAPAYIHPVSILFVEIQE